MSQVQSILFVCYPKCGEQDTLAPWEMLKSLAWVMSQDGEQLDVKLGAFDEKVNTAPNMNEHVLNAPEEVTMQMGGVINLEQEITPDSRADLLYVPGGIGSGEATKDARIRDLIHSHNAEGRWVATNCSGIGILHRAGILRDTPVTAAATVSRKLTREGVNVKVPRAMWECVPDRKIFSAAGGSAVHPSTIALIWYLFGEQRALTLSLMWDSLGAFGKVLFELEGPDYGTYPQYENKLQDDWENNLLPDPV
jgi:putative intracellular protease/amidase